MKEKVQESEIKMEDVLESIGGFGYFQKIFAFMTIYPQLAAGMIVLSPVFTGTENVPLYCSNQTNEIIGTYTCDLNCTEAKGNEVFSSVVQQWDLVCSRAWIVDAITSCQMAGMMSGALLSSLVSDNFGRTKGFFFVTFGMGCFGILPSVSVSPIMYAVTRFLAGFGMGGCFIVYLIHLMEFLTPSYRTICGCVSLWPIGEMLLGLFAHFIPNWRYLTVITAAPTFVVLLFFPFIQESPRWLLTRKKTQEAHEVLEKIAKWNSRSAPPIATVEALQATVLKEEADVLKGFQGIKQIFQNKRLRLSMLILTWSNVGCAIVYYGVSFSAKSLSGNSNMNMFYMGILDLVAIPAVMVFNDRLGRKKTFLIYITLASVFLASILVMNYVGEAGVRDSMVVTILALSGRFCIVCCWAAQSCIIMETFPTTLRTTCMGFIAFAGYLGGVLAPQTVFLGKISLSIPYILYCSLTSSSSILFWFLHEMAGEPLNDTAGSGLT